MTTRERILQLLDEGTFVETDAHVVSRAQELAADKVAGDGAITGYGTIDGRLTYVSAQDSAFLGGALGEMQAKKIADIVDMAVKMGAPYVGMIDCSGARIQEGLDALNGFGKIMSSMSAASGVIPQIMAVMGPCPAGMSFVAAMADFVFMTESAEMSVNGAELIKAAGDLNATAKTVGGIEINAEKNGMAHFTEKDDAACISNIKKLLSILPDNNLSGAPRAECADDLNRFCDSLGSLTAAEDYDIKTVINTIADDQNFIEVHAAYAKNMVCGFVRLNGATVGVAANQNAEKEGQLSVKACTKAAGFVRFCDSFNIPILTLTDTAGFVPCLCEEKQGLAKAVGKMVYAFTEASVPKVNVVINKAYGSAYVAMNSKSIGADFSYAWSGSDIAPLDPVTCASVLYHDEIAASGDQAVCRREKAEEYRKAYATPVNAAAKGYIDDIIEPGATRARVISAFEMLSSKRAAGPARKHGNIRL